MSSFKEESHWAGKGSYGLSLGDHSVNHPAVSLLNNPPELQFKAGVEIGARKAKKERLAVEKSVLKRNLP